MPGVTHLSLADLVARTEAMRAAGAVPVIGHTAPATLPPCPHEGGIITTCPGCRGEDRHVRWCSHDAHHSCVRNAPDKATSDVTNCATCEHHPARQTARSLPLVNAPPPPPVRSGPVGKRHLIYHLLPVSGNGVWQRGVDALRLRWGLFGGRKVVAVATGAPVREQVDAHEGVAAAPRTLALDPVAAVRAYLPADCEVIEVRNDPGRWELASWAALWARALDGADDSDAVMYAHAKGVTRRPGSPCHRWADLLYSLSLDHWPEVAAALRRYPIAGSLVKRGRFFSGSSLSLSAWHFSGNFWWARAREIRAAVAAVPVPVDRWGAEAWPGIAFPASEVGEVFGVADSAYHLYRPADLDRVITAHARWLANHKPVPPPQAAPARRPAGVRLSVIVPTTGRASLGRTLDSITSQLRPGDELIVRPDRTGDWGATPRAEGQRQATGDYLLWMDDDDAYLPGALDRVRAALRQNPGRPHLFRMRRDGGVNDTLPHVEEVREGQVSTQMFCVPNDPPRLGVWGARYAGDYDFISSTLALYPPGVLVWRDEVIAVWRPAE